MVETSELTTEESKFSLSKARELGKARAREIEQRFYGTDDEDDDA